MANFCLDNGGKLALRSFLLKKSLQTLVFTGFELFNQAIQ